MREFLEDAFAHQDDGYGRAQKHLKRELPKRFYTETGVVPVAGGFAVTLDEAKTRTPGKTPIVVPSEALAQEMAAEWAAQQERVDPLTMPVVRLVNSGIEGGEKSLPALRQELVKYSGTDLLCYRAESPRELVGEQEKHWDPVLTLIARHFSVSFQTTVGIMHRPQPDATLRRLAEALEGVSLLRATAMVSVAGLTGSGLMAVGLGHQLLDAEQVWAAAHVDEDYNARLWGSDPEAEALRRARWAEYEAALKVLAHLA